MTKGEDGKLNEISAKIGGLEAITSRLTELFDRHCSDDDRRHAENTGTLREIRDALQPLTRTVAAMEPIVAGFAVSQWKRAGAFGLAMSLLAVFAWILERAIGAAVEWLALRVH